MKKLMFFLPVLALSSCGVSLIKNDDLDNAQNSVDYYSRFKLSLNGGANSEADKFTQDLYRVMIGDQLEFRHNFSNLGDKFFVAYVSGDCSNCGKAAEGFAEFEKDFSIYVGQSETNQFHLVTIFADEETSETTSNTSAFVKYLERNQSFFAEVGSRASETGYYNNGHLSDDDITAMETADPDDFLTPTIFLVELSSVGRANDLGPGVTEVMFGIEGNTKIDRAQTLRDCWKHIGNFSA